MCQENVALEEPGGGSFKYQVREFVQGHTGAMVVQLFRVALSRGQNGYRPKLLNINCIFQFNFRHFLSITEDLSEKGFRDNLLFRNVPKGSF